MIDIEVKHKFSSETKIEDSITRTNCSNLFLAKTKITEEEAQSVIRCQASTEKRRCTKCGSSLKPQSLKKKMHQVWFIIKVPTTKEDALCVVLHQSRNCKRRCTKCGSSSKSQLQKKMPHGWLFIKDTILQIGMVKKCGISSHARHDEYGPIGLRVLCSLSM
ncbi:hypothetical protein H5410_050906 [Solanum commersonii]|uniref:Uncharacterized protein n=1 Tax=Solanum commersonii TaxID=4109 RepID=A0A9J5WY42_SOLCO|nr:hypothetical protein H5410_050906 [Solanum commersonii]